MELSQVGQKVRRVPGLDMSTAGALPVHDHRPSALAGKGYERRPGLPGGSFRNGNAPPIRMRH